jgi:FkbM family methyltransferase
MNVEKNQKAEIIKISQIALSNDDDFASFNFSGSIDFSESSGSHLEGVETPLTVGNYSKFEKIDVATRRIDTLISDQFIEPAQIVKIDVEGAEMLVLEGGREFFRNYMPLIFMEIHNITMMCEVSNFLHSIGYTIEIIDKDSASSSWCFICASPIIENKKII